MEKSLDFGSARRTAHVLSDNLARRTELETLANNCSCVLVAEGSAVSPDDPDFLLVDLRAISDPLPQSISRMARYLNGHRGNALIWTDLEGLEAVYAQLPYDNAHFLVDADDIEAVPILVGVFGQGNMNRVQDKDRPLEFGALHRISDELAGFARTLARIAEQDSVDGSRLNDKPISFRPAPAGSFHPFPSVSVGETPEIDSKMVRELIKLRRLRDSYFVNDLFADPAWDILLDLMASRLERRQVSVSSLCIAAAVPPTTALRWITAMTESGMLVRQNDPNDARRVFIGLSSDTETTLRRYLSDVRNRSLPVV